MSCIIIIIVLPPGGGLVPGGRIVLYYHLRGSRPARSRPPGESSGGSRPRGSCPHSFYIALFLLRSKRFTVYYHPGDRIQNQFCTQSALSPLPWEHACQSLFDRPAHAHMPTHHNTVCIDAFVEVQFSRLLFYTLWKTLILCAVHVGPCSSDFL